VSRERGYRFAVDQVAPTAAREATERELQDLEWGPKLTAGLLTGALVATCIRGEGGEVHVGVTVKPDLIRVEVTGSGHGFRLPLSSRAIDYLCIGDEEARPVGWRSYLLDQLAERWGVDERNGLAWFEVDHASAEARRLISGRKRAVRTRRVA
jgi:hypothetical protein